MSHLITSRKGRSGNDPIFALSKAAADRRAQGGDVINATLGALFDDTGKLATLDTVTRAVRDVPAETLAAYAPIAGPPDFLDAVKRDLFAGAPDLLARAVAVATPGGSGALRHVIVTFLEEGQALVTTSFYWGPYATLAGEHARSVKAFRMFDEKGSLDTSALDRAIAETMEKQGRALVLLNDPCHNPTGYSMSDDDWSRVSSVVEKHATRGPLSVVLDSAYAAFSPGAIERPIRALAGLSDRVLVGFAWSASKSFLAYGQRVGALVVVPAKKEEMGEIEASLAFSCRGTWSNCNHAGMKAVTRCLVDPELRPRVDSERKKAADLLAERVAAWNDAARPLGLRYPRYDGGFFVTVTSSDPERHAAALREKDVFVVPLAGALRVALCSVPKAQIPRLANAMADVMK